MNMGIIKNQICIGAAVFNSFDLAQRFFNSGAWPEADEIALLPEEFGIGDEFINGQWVKVLPEEPLIPLETLQELKLKEIVSVRDEIERQPIIYMGIKFKTDSDSLIRMNIAAESARNALLSGEDWSINWVDGVTSTIFNAAEFLGLMDAIAERNNQIFEISRSLKKQVESAATNDEIKAIQWPEDFV